METAAQIKPSPEARTLFGTMTVLAQPVDEQVLHLDLSSTIAAGCRRARRGQDAGASSEVLELLDEEWIHPAPDGGWLLG